MDCDYGAPAADQGLSRIMAAETIIIVAIVITVVALCLCLSVCLSHSPMSGQMAAHQVLHSQTFRYLSGDH